MQVPTLLTRAVLILVGIALGSVVSPETLQGFATYPASISILAVAILIMLLGTSTYLRVVHGWDRLSAVLGASPGSLSQVMALAEEMRADVRAVAVVQTMRVIVLSAGLPTALMLLGYSGPSQAGGADDRAAAIGELAVLIPFSSLVAYLLSRVGFPGGWLFGAMLG
jgi:membrane AbrB-like protein